MLNQGDLSTIANLVSVLAPDFGSKTSVIVRMEHKVQIIMMVNRS